MRELTYREAIREALRQEMKRDEKVFLLGEEIAEYGGAYKVTKGLVEEFGRERVRNTPLAEAAIAGASLGSALVGMRPVAEFMYVDFTPIAMDQIFNQIAKLRYMTGGMVTVPLVIRTQGGGGVAAGPHHSQSWEALFTHVPGLIVVMPATPYDAKGLMKASIRENNPVIYIEHKGLYNQSGEVPEDDYLVPLGKAEVKREGSDITVISWSRSVVRALKAAETLEKEGISLEVVDLRTLRPLDEGLILDSVLKTSRAMVVHEACRTSGYGAEVAATIAEKAFDYLDAPVQRVAAYDAPVPFNPNLENYVLPNEDRIIEAAKELLGK
ncbi:alpha-ketoacid dehydrogenase subunit beta [Chloroflexota bacterium]